MNSFATQPYLSPCSVMDSTRRFERFRVGSSPVKGICSYSSRDRTEIS